MASRKQGRRAPAGRRKVVAVEQGGVLARMADQAIENPAMSGGLFVMALTVTAIFSNALFLQKAQHPEPIFSTRSAVTEPAPVPLPRARVAPTDQAPPVPRDAPATAKPAAAGQASADAQKDIALVGDIQRALAGIGLYRGPVDGKFGAQTHASIAAFERREGLTVTGNPSPAILARINQKKTAAAKPAPAVTPAPTTPVQSAPAAPVAKAAPDPAALAAARYRRIQTALNDIGYGPLEVNGQSGGETEDAIRRFELDNGLPLTGTADDAVIARLIKIGAMAGN